jgi:hypothetical protein
VGGRMDFDLHVERLWRPQAHRAHTERQNPRAAQLPRLPGEYLG